MSIENRSDYLAFKVTPRERLALMRMTKTEGRKLSEMLREIVREAALRRNCWPVDEPTNQTGVNVAG